MIENLRLFEEAADKVETCLVCRPTLAITDLGFHQFISGKQFFNRKHHLQGHRGESLRSPILVNLKAKYTLPFQILGKRILFFSVCQIRSHGPAFGAWLG